MVREIAPDLQVLQSIVDGYIEHVTLPGEGHLYCDEEGKLKHAPVNNLATSVAMALGWMPGLTGQDVLCGTVVFLGDGDEGEEDDVPPSVVAIAQIFAGKDL